MCKNSYIDEVEKLGLRLNDTQDMLMRPKKPFPNNLIIPDGVSFINKEAFRSFPKLESVIMPDSVIRIGDYVFTKMSCTFGKAVISAVPHRAITIGALLLTTLKQCDFSESFRTK